MQMDAGDSLVLFLQQDVSSDKNPQNPGVGKTFKTISLLGLYFSDCEIILTKLSSRHSLSRLRAQWGHLWTDFKVVRF